MDKIKAALDEARYLQGVASDIIESLERALVEKDPDLYKIGVLGCYFSGKEAVVSSHELRAIIREIPHDLLPE